MFKRLASLFTALMLPTAAADGAPVIANTSPLTGCVLNAPYSNTLTATGGTAPYSYVVTGGALPSGMVLATNGALSGTPGSAGRFSFTVTATDALNATASATFAMQSFLQLSANNFGMPAPTDTTTYDVVDGTSTVHVPSGFVYVPRGSFTYGTGTTAVTYTLDGFCTGRFEVTNAEYKAYLTATGSTSYPSYWTGGNYPTGRGNHPMLFVSLIQANAYAAWISAQTGWTVVVPTAYQWEKAARGPNAYLYPWGNTLGSSYANGVLVSKSNNSALVTSYYLNNYGSTPATYNNPLSTHYNQTVTVGTIAAYDTSDVATPLAVTSGGSVNGYVNHTTYTGFIYTDVFDGINNTGGFTMPAGSYESGISAFGAYDVAGNAYEWTTTTFIASNGAEASLLVNEVRGGGWYSNGTSGQSIDTGEGRSATGGYNSVGFRLVMLPPGYGSSFSITTEAPLTSGMVASTYSQQFASTGGNGLATWSLAGGSLPAGLTLTSSGLLSGTPTQGGTFTFTMQAADVTSTVTTKTFTLVIAAANVLDHFTWDYVASSISAGTSFATKITARDSTGALVTFFSGTASLGSLSTAGAAGTSPIVITEVTPANENQIELQNMSNAAVNTSGWFMCIGDSTTNSTAGMNTLNSVTYALPSGLAAGQLLRITESTTNTANGRVPFGGAIAWVNTPGNRRGWVALFDSTNTLRDFFAFGWTATDLANFGINVNGQSITLSNQWSGAGTPSSGSVAGQTFDSFQRLGSSDTNTPSDWAWRHNADNTDATSFGVTNTGLTVPWTFATPLTVSPANVTFVNGVFIGNLTVGSASTNASVTATFDAFSGNTGVLVIGAVLVSTAGDGIPDAWKTANGFSTSANIAVIDSDGDGATNLQEYLAGTNPKSAASKLGVTSFAMPSAREFDITWPGVAGKIYRVTASSDLATWTQTGPNILCVTSGIQSFALDPGGSTKLFIRIEITP